jgi:hypothetical protein
MNGRIGEELWFCLGPFRVKGCGNRAGFVDGRKVATRI